MNTSIPDPIRHTVLLISPDAPDALEERIKRDVFQSISRIKPAVISNVDFASDVMFDRFFERLSAPLQGIAIARTEGVMAFYNRVGWTMRSLLPGENKFGRRQSPPEGMCILLPASDR